MRDHKKERAIAREKAKELVSKMTLMEKASQLKYDASPVERLGVPTYNYWNEALHCYRAPRQTRTRPISRLHLRVSPTSVEALREHTSLTFCDRLEPRYKLRQ